MFVAASTRCFPNVYFTKSLQQLADLDYHAAEVVVSENANDLTPELIAQDFRVAVKECAVSRQVTPETLLLDLPVDAQDYLATFENCVRLCQALRMVTLVVKSAPLGSPYNVEVERLRKLTQIGARAGVVVALLTEQGAASGSIDSLESLCNVVPALTVALDPSHFIYGHARPVNYDSIIPRVSHVRLRDTTEKVFQVKTGQGKLEYNRLDAQLEKANYRRALCVDLAPTQDWDANSELRKMRLLVESIL